MHSCKKMELLAPAGEWTALLAALAAGADAVYLGGKLFNARQSAANFDREQMKAATDLLHMHQRKIYVTVNTLMQNSELNKAIDYLADLYNLGIDAVIVQDLGLVQAARRYLPQLELHASTQMTVHNSEGALLLKELGMERIVLARELSAAEIQSIRERTGMELEVFVHGALCVCYSGQCLMSSIIGGRSGNRGRCAQPCRLEYRLLKNGQTVPAEGLHLLSPKDIALISVIPDLHCAGVAALKIEGRMKRPEYVYTVTKTYRKALDSFYMSPSGYQVDPSWLKTLEQTFNRGFTTGYFGGVRNKPLMSFSRPNNRGIYLGRVKKIEQNQISVRLETSLEVGDEVEVWVSKGGRATASLEKLFSHGRTVFEAMAGDEVSFPISGKVYPGDRIFKVFSSKVARETQAAINETNPDLKIPCTLKVYGRLNQPLTLVYCDDMGNEGISRSEMDLQTAKTRPLTETVLREQLGRLGTSLFFLKEFDLDLDSDVMLPLSTLNQMRRTAIQQLEKKRLQPYERPKITTDLPAEICNNSGDALKNNSFSPKISVWAGDLEGIRAAIEAGADLIYAGGDELNGFHWESDLFHEAAAICHEKDVCFVIGIPRINREGHRSQWLKYLEDILKIRADGIMVSDLGALEILLKTEAPLYLNYPLNFFNNCSIQSIRSKRIKQWTVSPELTLAQISEISRKTTGTLECLIHGPLELMISEYCPIHAAQSGKESCNRQCRQALYALRDRMDIDFPVVADQFCRMHLLNSKDLCLYGDLNKFAKQPLMLRLELKTYLPQDVAFITAAYRFALKMIQTGQELPNGEKVIERFKALSGRGITKGHFFRGVE